ILSSAINSIAIYYIAVRDLFKEDLQNCNSDFIDPSKLLLASSLSPLPISKLAKQTKASTTNQFSSHNGDLTPS
ncbi:hypothetical protein V2W45_1232627, partial [Cenococcum geophilum]